MIKRMAKIGIEAGNDQGPEETLVGFLPNVLADFFEVGK